MRKIVTILFVFSLISILFAGCCLSHEWEEASCTAPKTCAKCGETEGEPIAHIWVSATCTNPEVCSICGANQGEALGHIWVDATCTSPKICLTCNQVEGDPRGHQAGDWTTITEPEKGNAGIKTRSCNVCNETVETEEFFYPYFNMSFEKFVKQHNETYSEQNWIIREVDTGFSYFMNSADETAIVFHSDMNGKTSGTATAYSTKKLEEFNELQVRIIDHGAKSIDVEFMPTMMMIGGAITQPLGGYELSDFCDEFLDKWVVTSSSNSYVEGEAVIDGYKYILRAYVVDDYYSRVFYEWICQTT